MIWWWSKACWNWLDVVGWMKQVLYRCRVYIIYLHQVHLRIRTKWKYISILFIYHLWEKLSQFKYSRWVLLTSVFQYSLHIYVCVCLNNSDVMNPQEKAQCVEWFVEEKSESTSKDNSQQRITRCHQRGHRIMFGTKGLGDRREMPGVHMCRMKMRKARVRSLFTARTWRHELWSGYRTVFRETPPGAVLTAEGSWRLSGWITHLCTDAVRWETKITSICQLFREILRASITGVIQTLCKVNLSTPRTLTGCR
jgi:hypothetical protein